MRNDHVHPAMAMALDQFAPAKPHRVFTVSISGRAPLNMLAPSSMSAISRAFELLFSDQDECPAEGLTISCKVAK